MKEIQKISPKVDKIIDFCVLNPTMQRKEIAKNCNVSYNTLHWYFRSPIFKDELAKRSKEIWKDSARMAQKKMIELAENNDFRAIQYILDSCGYKAPEVVNLNTNTIHVDLDD